MEVKKINGLLAIPIIIGSMMVAGLFALLPNAVSAESPRATTAVLWEEDFETDGNGSRYTPSEVCNDGPDYFTRTNGADIDGVYNLPNNSYYWAAQDTDHAPCTMASQSIVFQTFTITGITDFRFIGMFAEDDDGSNEDWDATDSVHVEYQVDGGAWVEILRFESIAESGFNAEPAEDTDFDGVGDGVRLTDTFTDFSKSFVASGSMMTVAIRTQLDSGDEDIAFDYLRVEEDVPTTLWVEDFETDGNGSRYTPSEVCSDNSGNYFTRTNGSDHGSFVVYNSPNGSYYWAGMDTDGVPCSSASQSIVFQAFDITGYENLVFRGLFAEDDDGSNQDWDASDSVHIQYQVDGGAWVDILRFESIAGSDFNTEPAEDTDFDGVGDGTPLTDTFAEFAKPIVTSGSMMTIAIRVENLNAGDEDIAFDYLRVEEGTIAVDELSLSKSVSPESGVFAGDLVTYTLLLESTGEESTAALTDTLPAGNEFAYWVELPAGAAVSANQVEWTGSVSSTQPVTFSFVVTNTASSETITNTAVYSGSGEMGSAEAVYTAVAEPAADGLVCFAESFEEAPGTTYTLSAAFDDGGFDFFNRYAVPDVSNGARDDFATGWDGNYGIMGQDHDGDGETVTQTVTIAAIDVTTATHAIKVQAALGALDSEDFQNYEPGDGIKIYATLDGGARTLIGEFAPPTGDGNLLLDTDGDGIGDGEALTVALADFDFAVSGTGNSLTIEIEMVSDAGFEPLALDNVRVLCGAPANVMINEVDADTSGSDTLEFIELYDGGFGNTPLDGLVMVGYNGNGDSSYNLTVDLDGYTTDENGYFVIGNEDVDNVNIIVGSNSVQNGADAIALFQANGSDFPNDTAITTANLLDAIVYDTNDSDDAGLLPLLNPGQPQVNEDDGGNKDGESNQRCANGSGGQRNTDTYEQHDPTPGAENVCGVVIEYGFNPIYTIQGNGDASPFDGGIITTVGVVVADFQDDGLGGFNLQDETGDGDTATSDGIYVFTGDATVTIPAVNVGDIVTVTAVVDEFNDLTELTEVSAITVGGTADITPTLVTLPLDDTAREQLEGMLIQVNETLYVTEIYELGRYGQVLLAPEGRQMQFTHDNAPDVSGYAAHLTAFANNTLKLDDKQTTQNPDPVIYPSGGLSGTNTLRGGDSVAMLTGVLHYAFGDYLLEPTESVDFVSLNPRPEVPTFSDGSLTVATMNVLNFFVTLDEGSAICGPSGSLDCRGAESASEFDRQRDKIIAALLAMDADVYGLVELENSNDNAALQSLIDGLNAVSSSTYAFVATGAVGDDAIRAGFIYKTETVETVGSFAVLDSSVDANFIDSKNRPAIAQTFQEKSSGERFTAAINHLKSKGSSCDDVSDPNLNDGSGNCNGTRQKAAEALATWLATDPTSSGDPDFLILGDLNAYRNETPITALEDAGYTDLAEAFTGDNAYSYVFSGEWGYLDYALANTALMTQVVDAAEWHINSDEPIVLDYNENFKSVSQLSTLYNDDAYRSSDHDPMMVRLQLGEPAVTETVIFLPLVMSQYVAAPDLVVESVAVSGSDATVVVRNDGTATVSDDFWVDLLLNPDTVPTAVNDTLETMGGTGMVWGVSDISIAPGESLTLTNGGDHYDSNLSTVSGAFASGDSVYVHVDSADVSTTVGAVNEMHELLGKAYNNILLYVVP